MLSERSHKKRQHELRVEVNSLKKLKEVSEPSPEWHNQLGVFIKNNPKSDLPYDSTVGLGEQIPLGFL